MTREQRLTSDHADADSMPFTVQSDGFVPGMEADVEERLAAFSWKDLARRIW
jgi:hypothetical protein